MNIAHNKILIIGGVSGIGQDIAERFINANNTVIICGRRQTALDEAKAMNHPFYNILCIF